MNIPALVLSGFAAWTLVILSVGVGSYHRALILSGRASVAAGKRRRRRVPTGIGAIRATKAMRQFRGRLPLVDSPAVEQ